MSAKVRSTYFFDKGEKRFLDTKSKTLFMPYNIEPEDYSPLVIELMRCGFVVQIEIV